MKYSQVFTITLGQWFFIVCSNVDFPPSPSFHHQLHVSINFIVVAVVVTTGTDYTNLRVRSRRGNIG